MYERKSDPLLPRRQFFGRVMRSLLAATCLVFLSLALGMIGYHRIEHLPWLDAFLNASMIMAGMGPVDAMKTNAGKLFAGLYALYCGLALLSASALLLAPVVHRFLHRFHIGSKGES